MDINNVLSDLTKTLSFSNTKSPSIPAPLRLSSSNRAGLSALKITEAVLKGKKKLGLPVGTLPDGSPNLDDAVIQLIIEEIINAIKFDAKIEVSIKPFGSIEASGVAGPGIPCQVTGIVTDIQTGGATIS